MWGFSFYLAMDVNGQLTGAKRWMLPIAKGSGRAVSWLLAVLLLTSVCFLFILCILLFSFRFVPTQIPPPPLLWLQTALSKQEQGKQFCS